MSRARTFNEDAVLWAAMDVFRRQGFARVSIKDLERATGLTTGSLYNAYGDKDGVFRAALDRYIDGFVAPRADAVASLDDLERLFLSMLEPPLDDGFGCLVANSAMEFGPKASPASEAVARGLAATDRAIETTLARELGEAGASEAAQLSVFYQGLLLLIRAGRAPAELRSVIADKFTDLRAKRANLQKGA